MKYPVSYGAAEHRCALDALISDLASHGQSAPRRPESGGESHADRPQILEKTSATGRCRVELRVNPEIIARA